MKKDSKNLKEIIAFEKSQMLPLNFMVSYILTPIYATVCFFLIGVFAVLMGIDDEKYFVEGLLCLGFLVLISVVFLASVPFVRKKAITVEMQRYDFDTSDVEEKDVFDFSTEDFTLKFDKNGMYVNEELFYYNHLNNYILTENYCKRVGIYIQFSLDEEHKIALSLSPETLKMLECFEVQLENKHILDYITTNKEDAFKQIYNKGYVIPRI